MSTRSAKADAARDPTRTLNAWIASARERIAHLERVGREESAAQLARAIEVLQGGVSEQRSESEELGVVVGQLEAARRRYQELFESAPDPYLTTDFAGVIREANRAARSLLGHAAGESEGKPLSDFMPQGARSEFQSRLVRLGRTEPVAEWEVELLPAQGAPVPVAIRAAAVQAAADAEEIRWLLRDVSDRRRAEEQRRGLQVEHAARLAAERAEKTARFLAWASEELSEILGFAAAARRVSEIAVPELGDFCIVDLVEGEGIRRIAGSHHDRELAPYVQTLLDFPPDATATEGVARVIRTREAEVIPHVTTRLLDVPATDPAHREALERLAPRSMLIVPLVARGETVGSLTLASARPGLDFGSLLLLAEEFSHRAALALENARLLEELLIARRAAEDANRIKSEFLGVISHELRTPLAAMMGYAELMVSGVPDDLPPGARRYVDRILYCAQHQRELVDQILSYARLEGGSIEVRPEPLNLPDLVRASAQLIAPQAAEKGLSLEVSAPDSLRIRSDPEKIRQVLLNLLSNAVRFTESGFVRVMVEPVPGGRARIRVADSGAGIPADKLERVFDRFWQAREPGQDTRGAGLGLAISRELARVLGGEIGVESQPGAGSTFTVTLPRRAPQIS